MLTTCQLQNEALAAAKHQGLEVQLETWEASSFQVWGVALAAACLGWGEPFYCWLLLLLCFSAKVTVLHIISLNLYHTRWGFFVLPFLPLGGGVGASLGGQTEKKTDWVKGVSAWQAERFTHNLDFKDVGKITKGSFPLNTYSIKHTVFSSTIISFNLGMCRFLSCLLGDCTSTQTMFYKCVDPKILWK